MSLLVYSENKTPRIDYIFSLMIDDIAGFSFQITHSKEEFEKHSGPKLSYGSSIFSSSIAIPNAGFLKGRQIEIGSVDFVVNNNIDCPFAIEGKEWDFPFDIFSAGFYLVTRCEEYVAATRDRHDRFSAFESMGFKRKFIETPVVNYWALELRKKITDKYPNTAFRTKSTQTISTIDVDQLFAIKARGWKRTLGRLGKNLINKDFKSIATTFSVLLKASKDPFDVFEDILSLHKKYNTDLIFFMHLGDYSTFDKSIRWTHRAMKDTIVKLAATATVGIHPSYRSNYDDSILEMEFGRYRLLLGYKPQKSRQHYLKLYFPETYAKLIQSGIREDYTMGYAECIGFRAGISTPFYFYNLKTEEQTTLKIYPFAVMDRALKDTMKLSVSESIEKIAELKRVVQHSEGSFVSLFHNESLSENKEWTGWRSVYESVLRH